MGYIKALWRYLQTEKGRHDFVDYLRAIIIMLAVMLILRFLLSAFCA